MNINYNEIKQDFNYLHDLVPLEDSWDVEAMVFDLMELPTKARAAEMYYVAVKRWFRENIKNRDIEGDVLVDEIKDKYNIS